MSRILIVEDDALVADFVGRGLRAHGYTTVATDEAGAGAALALTGDFDLVILDIGLPGGDGFALLQHVRGVGSRVPVIVLTGRPDQRDAVDCLDHGADDYMTKPFRFDELLARVRVRLRRTGTDEPDSLTAAGVTLDLRSRRAEVDGREIELTAREFAILELFMRHPGHVLSRAQLLSHVWGYFFDPGTNVVNVYVSALRKKLGANRIETVRGTGYRLQTIKTPSPSPYA
jgi:DNA-binding response OmpR family regulator